MRTAYILACLALLIGVASCEEDTIGLELKGNLQGRVVDESGVALDSVRITTSPASSTTFTDENGDFSLSNILVDNYSVQAEKDGYVTGFEAVAITENETSEVAFELREQEGENRPPGVPQLIAPEDGSAELDLEVTFIWSSSDPEDDEITYTLELRNGKNNEVEIFEIVQDTSLVVNTLQLGTNYLWQVSASDGTNDPVRSSISSFSTLTSPENPYLFVRQLNGNNVIFSGNENPGEEADPDANLFQLTDESTNSFRPRSNQEVNRIAFLRNIGSDTHIFTMDPDGSNVQQVTSTVPVAGFRQSEVDFTWAQNGAVIYYPNFDRLFRINPNGGGSTLVYQTPDGSLISEVAVAELDQDLILLKTNNLNGYDVRIFTYRLSSATEENIVLENVSGAAGSIDITANGDKVLYNLDLSGSENSIYRRFSDRLFIYDLQTGTATELETDVVQGQNDYDAKFSPSEGAVIFTRSENNVGAPTFIFKRSVENQENDDLLFTEAFMPDW
jgi:Tol biopolymer transport system component